MFSEEILATAPIPTAAIIEGDGSNAGLSRYTYRNFYPARIWFYDGDHLGQPLSASPAAQVTVKLRPRYATAIIPDATEFQFGSANNFDCRIHDGLPTSSPPPLPYSTSSNQYTFSIPASHPHSQASRCSIELVVENDPSGTIEGAEEIGMEIVEVEINDPNYTGRPVAVGSDHTMFRWIILDDE